MTVVQVSTKVIWVLNDVLLPLAVFGLFPVKEAVLPACRDGRGDFGRQCCRDMTARQCVSCPPDRWLRRSSLVSPCHLCKEGVGVMPAAILVRVRK